MSIKEYLEQQKAKCDERIEAIDNEVAALSEKNAASEDEAELKEIGEKLADLEAEKAELVAELKEVEAQIADLDKPADDGENKPARRAFLQFEKRGEKNIMTIEERKQAAEEFKTRGKKTITIPEYRSVLVSSGKIATPTEVEGITPTFNRVSSIVDLVKVVNCAGMGANKVAYEKAIGTADTQTEGSAVNSSDPEYDFVTITPTSIGILSLVSNQVRHQSPLDYEGKIVDSAEKALRVKAAAIITAAITASALIVKPTDLKITAVDEKTLRKIAFAYGSDESIYGDAWLFLTKKDLIAFGDVRSDTTLQAVYEITPDTANPNTGVIKDGGLAVRYCLNPNLTALADASENGVAMFYGQAAECAELDLFSDYEIAVSEDYAFNTNMLAIRGTAELGAGVIKNGGFVCVTKGA